jgi:hypothetical protein
MSPQLPSSKKKVHAWSLATVARFEQLDKRKYQSTARLDGQPRKQPQGLKQISLTAKKQASPDPEDA